MAPKERILCTCGNTSVEMRDIGGKDVLGKHTGNLIVSTQRVALAISTASVETLLIQQYIFKAVKAKKPATMCKLSFRTPAQPTGSEKQWILKFEDPTKRDEFVDALTLASNSVKGSEDSSPKEVEMSKSDAIGRARLLAANKEDQRLFHLLVTINHTLTPEEFWQSRKIFVEELTDQPEQILIESCRPLEFIYSTNAEGHATIIVAEEAVHELFKKFPQVHSLYDSLVPHRYTSAQFWEAFSRSRFYCLMEGKEWKSTSVEVKEFQHLVSPENLSILAAQGKPCVDATTVSQIVDESVDLISQEALVTPGFGSTSGFQSLAGDLSFSKPHDPNNPSRFATLISRFNEGSATICGAFKPATSPESPSKGRKRHDEAVPVKRLRTRQDVIMEDLLAKPPTKFTPFHACKNMLTMTEVSNVAAFSPINRDSMLQACISFEEQLSDFTFDGLKLASEINESQPGKWMLPQHMKILQEGVDKKLEEAPADAQRERLAEEKLQVNELLQQFWTSAPKQTAFRSRIADQLNVYLQHLQTEMDTHEALWPAKKALLLPLSHSIQAALTVQASLGQKPPVR
eukprot:Platyproteum_vivax@DN6488_c0_g1_i1.p1